MRPLLLAALLVSACGGSAVSPSSPLDTQVTVTLGQSTMVAEAGVSIRFDEVQDSRCPADAFCITAGFAVTKLAIVSTRGAQSLELRTDPPAARSTVTSGLRVDLVQVDPYPYLSRPTPAPPYQATVHLRR